MPVLQFSDLPDSARLWTYGAERALTADEVQALQDCMADFLAQWHSHQQAVAPTWQLLHDRFVVICVDESMVGLSGCSIDSMVRNLQEFSRAAGVDFAGGGNLVFYRHADGGIRRVDRLAFRDLAKQGAVDENTIVFDTTVATAGAFRAGRWEVPMREAWHMDAFGGLLPSSS